jgi:GYF domain 2
MSDTKSELVWYIAREGQQHGPLTDTEMRLFVKGGHLKPTDLVWNPEMTDWQSAATVFPPPPAAPPTPPPPPPPKAAAPEPRKAAGGPHVGARAATEQAAASKATAARPSPSLTGRTADADDAFPNLRAHRGHDATASRSAQKQPATLNVYEDEDVGEGKAAGRGGRVGMLIGTVAVAAAIAGGGVVAFQNKDAILKYMNEKAGSATADGAPPVVKADNVTKTASIEKPTPPPSPASEMQSRPAAPPIQGVTVTVPPSVPDQSAETPDRPDAEVPLATIDNNLQKSQLWRVIKDEFPDWYKERVEEISKLSNSASETDLSRHLIGKLVALRREHASQALASSTEHLQNIANAFLANLKSLAGHSTEACYTFISKGETSPTVISLFPKPGYGDAIEGQIAAVFRAVADGRKSPVKREKASKPDYDILAAELTKIGWSKADLGLFSNPQALAKAPPQQVCKMVQDWFTAHVSIKDKAVQERLLVETLRPVVAG